MKIFSAQQIYTADTLTVKRQQITSTILMERAGKQVFDWIHTQYKNKDRKIYIFCGTGNNGGDGLVIGRYLKKYGYTISMYTIPFGVPSADFSINLERLKALDYTPQVLDPEHILPEIPKEALVIDAIFGIGCNRPPSDWIAAIVQHINKAEATVVSIDIPSGLYMHAVPENKAAIVKASVTLTFQCPKLIFFLPETGAYIGDWKRIDIGWDREYLRDAITDAALITKSTLLKWYRSREKFSHKGNYGHGLLIGGSYGKTGAVLLAARACITTGAGLVTAYIPKCANTILQTSLPEAMTITDEGNACISNIQFAIQPNVIGIGVGLGIREETQQAVLNFIRHNNIPMVIDADGLNILAEHKEILHALPPKTILTPHPKELERLIGPWKDDFEKLEKVKTWTKKYHIIIVIKGAHTIVVDEDTYYINTTGNPGMATAGSGDVLTGMITGLIAQGYRPVHAAIFGVYLHGSSGDLAFEKMGYEALTAGKIIDHIGAAFLKLLN